MTFYDPRLGGPAYGPPRLQFTMQHHMPRLMPAAPLARPGQAAMGPAQGPTGIAAMLQRPGLRDALLAFGSAMLAQSDQPGSTFGGAVGRALPHGMQAFQMGRQEAEIDELMASAPESMRRLLKALPSQTRVPALLSLMKQPEPVKLGANERLIDPTTHEEIVGAVIEPEEPLKGLSSDMRDALFTLGATDPAALTDEQRQAAAVIAKELKRSSATSVTVDAGDKAQQTAIGKYYGATFGDIMDAGRNAAGKIQQLERLQALLDSPGVYQGTKGEEVAAAKRLAISMGMDVEGVAEAEAAEAIGKQMALDLRNPAGGAGMPGALSDKDREFLVAMTPSLSKTPEGNKLIIEAARRVAQRQAAVAKIVRDYANANGGNVDAGVEDAIQRAFANSDLFSDLKQGSGAGVYQRFPNIRPRGQ